MINCIIFDCDGVLVDSEIIAHQVGINGLEKLGYKLTIEDSIKKFTGKNDVDTRQLILKESAANIPDNFFSQGKLLEETLNRFKLELKPLLNQALEDINTRKVDRCVASSSPRERVVFSLNVTNQLKFFLDENIFTSQQVKNGKPAPDLFLFAAKRMGHMPENCIVIEDSVSGIEAALAAKMKVIGFLGGAHAQYEWYQNRIKEYRIPIAYDNQGLLDIIENW